MKTESVTAAPSVVYTATHVILGWNVGDIASGLAAVVSFVWLVSFFWNAYRKWRIKRDLDQRVARSDPPSQLPPSS